MVATFKDKVVGSPFTLDYGIRFISPWLYLDTIKRHMLQLMRKHSISVPKPFNTSLSSTNHNSKKGALLDEKLLFFEL